MPVLLLVLTSTASEALGQFRMPLPAHFSADSVCAIKALEPGRQDTSCLTPAAANIQIETDTVRRGNLTVRVPRTRRYIVSAPSIRFSDEAIKTLYNSKGLSLLPQFSAAMGEDRAYLASTLVEGILGRFHFDLSYAQVVTSPDTAPDSLRKEIRDNRATITRLVENGGSITMRLLMPLFAGGGTNQQHSAGVYLNGGAIGPLSESDSLRPTAGFAMEYLTSFAIRNAATYEKDAELFFGFRLGHQHVFERRGIIQSEKERDLTFTQVGLGIRTGDSTLLYLLWTRVAGNDFNDFIPKFQVSLQVPGL